MTTKKTKFRKRILNHLGKVSLAFLSFTLMSGPASALDPAEAANQVIGSEGGQAAAKEVLNNALKVAKGKPALSVAAGIVCVASIPCAGVGASASMCVACGILIAKVIG